MVEHENVFGRVGFFLLPVARVGPLHSATGGQDVKREQRSEKWERLEFRLRRLAREAGTLCGLNAYSYAAEAVRKTRNMR